jgi:N-carbamoyl-L-amino-acid hydrolase
MPGREASFTGWSDLHSDLAALAQFGARPEGGVTRPVYSDAYAQACDWLEGRMQDAGMTTRRDAVGNVIGRLGPADAPAILCGSHIDTVPNGGRFDGALGVLAGLAVARRIGGSAPLPYAFEVVAFADEEGAYLGELGARCMAGTMTHAELAQARNRDGKSLTGAMQAQGLNPDRFEDAQRDAKDLHAYLELHIEQGPVLEHARAAIGVVESIVGLHINEMQFEGEVNHAGTTPLDLRKDAFRAAAQTVATAFQKVETSFPPETRLTFGAVEVLPGAANVVPGHVRMTCEIRAASEAVISSVLEEVDEIAKAMARATDTTYRRRLLSRDAPAVMDPAIRGIISGVCETHDYPSVLMPSGAGHDAQVMASLCPTGMIFVPSRAGVSHSPREYTEPAQIDIGAQVLLETVRKMMA